MKQLNFSRIALLFLALSGIFLNSCKNNQPSGPDYQYFLANQHEFDITTTESKAMFSSQAGLSQGAILDAIIQSDVQVEKLTYITTFQNKNIQASGLVCVPKNPGNYPILCFQNGTNTLHSAAPSENPQDTVYQFMESVASMGFIVVMPDYIGFGASANLPHPYLHRLSTIQSILDMLRAVKEFGSQSSVEAKPTDDLFIFGYSQGGWATLALQKEIETNYSTEFNLKASSCGAGPYSLQYMNQYILSQPVYPMPYFLAYLLNSYKNLDLMPNPLSDFFKEPYASEIPDFFDGTHSGGDINAELTTNLADLLTSEYRTEYDTNSKFTVIDAAFLANSVTLEGWKNLSTPTHLYHAESDTYIPINMSQKMYQDFLAKWPTTDKVEFIKVPGDHSTGVIPVGIKTIMWFLTLK